MDTKTFLLHVSRAGTELYTETFFSRKALAEYLRNAGLHFANGTLCKIGDSSVRLYGKEGFVYEIEEAISKATKALAVDGRLFLPIKQYCIVTGESRSSVSARFRKRQIPGLYVGKPDRIYIYWRDSDE